jgi:hypothetical protein
VSSRLSWLESVDGPNDPSSFCADSSAPTDEFCGSRRSVERSIENGPPMTELRSETFDVWTATLDVRGASLAYEIRQPEGESTERCC